MHSFFVSPQTMAGQSFLLDPKDAAHVSGPLRLTAGDQIIVNDGAGQRTVCVLTNVDNKQVRAEVVERLVVQKTGPTITLFQGLIKGPRMDLVIEKTTELGVDRIVPLTTERTVVKGDSQKFGNKVERWQRLTEEAAKQSRRAFIPEILPVISLADACHGLKEQGVDRIIVPWEQESSTAEELTPTHLEGAGSIGLFIGPEGGFSESEIQMMRSAGARTVSLGPNILRAETAAITAVALTSSHSRVAK